MVQEIIRYFSDGDIVNIQLISLNEKEQKIKRTFKLIEFELVRICLLYTSRCV